MEGDDGKGVEESARERALSSAEGRKPGGGMCGP